MKKAFTLMEVNLAILIMAGGILSIVGLYSLGYRESRQSREDVASAAYADAVMSPIIMAASATNIVFSKFYQIGNYPSDNGWKDYLDSNGDVSSDPTAKARSVFSAILGKLSSAAEGSLNIDTHFPEEASGDLSCGLVVTHSDDLEDGGSLLRISFRASKNRGELMSAPLYYTEVRFQGIQDNQISSNNGR